MVFELSSNMIVNDNDTDEKENETVNDLNTNAPVANSVSGMDSGLMGVLDNIEMTNPKGGKDTYTSMDANNPTPVVIAAPVKKTRKRNTTTVATDVIENTVDDTVDSIQTTTASVTPDVDNVPDNNGDDADTTSDTPVNTNNDNTTAPVDATSDNDSDDEEIVTNTDACGVVIGSDAFGFALTNDNYYSDAANKVFMSNSLFKAVYGTPVHPYPCEDAAINGPKAESEALLIGGYVDSWFEGQAAFDTFKADHENQLMMKSGKDYLKFVRDADEALEKVSKDPMFMDFAKKGSHQTIMVGKIAGQAFKIKMDAYHPNDKIVDVKYVKNADMVWNDVKKERITFIEDYGYDIQGAIYQEIVYQNTGKKLPFYIAFITKERDESDFDIVNVDQRRLDEALEFVKMQLIARPYANVLAAPHKCGRKKCPWCKAKKIITAPKSYDEFIKYCS
jgi:hypothetical protein